MMVWAQRRRLPGGAPKELPDELRGLDTQQKAALDKLVHGEQFDLSLTLTPILALTPTLTLTLTQFVPLSPTQVPRGLGWIPRRHRRTLRLAHPVPPQPSSP